ncbi:MAG TPA: FAD-dependent oxidoreductase [Gemmataceae bacterium]|nr:FAD-dependent oxidoreductase [Gemmataceae bacterium]
MIQALRRPALVVVGTGMAGAKVVEEVLARDPDRYQIRMFGAEPHGTYNRILLSSVLGGHQDPSRLWLNPLEWYEDHGVFVHPGVKAEKIDRKSRVVVGAGGKVAEPYDALVLATGSRPFVPPLEGARQRGVFVFRTLEDCSAIAAYAQECDRALVIGGGLLGLEAARGLLSHGLEVTVVEVAPHLMVQQLDPTGGALLRQKLEAMGVNVLLEKASTHILGENGTVTGVRFKDGSTLETDMVVISCGIRPNVDEAKAAGLAVEKAIVVDDQLRTSDPAIFAVGECAQHRGKLYGLVDPVYEQARVLADVLARSDSSVAYRGSRLSTTLKVMGVELTTMGEVHATDSETEVVSHLDPVRGVYKKLVLRDNRLVGAVLLGATDTGGQLQRLFKSAEPLPGSALDLLAGDGARDALLQQGADADLLSLPDDTQICNCHAVQKGQLIAAINEGKCSVEALGQCTRAGTGCGTCQPLLGQLLQACGKGRKEQDASQNKVEAIKKQKNGLDCLPDVYRLAANNNWAEMSEADKARAKWYGLFFRPPTPGNFMLRLRHEAGKVNARQLRVIADLSDEYGKGFCDLTTRQQLQMRWFTLGDVPEIWRRLEEVGLHSKQTGMDNVRGVCGCPVGGLTPHELLDAGPVIRQFNEMLVGNKEFTDLPRKFNVTITGCLENCCHTETQDIGLVPAYRELDGQQVNGFNVLVGGKQGSGGYRPASPLDVFVRPEDAAEVCAAITLIFRDHGSRATRNRSRLAFLIEDRGIAWFRAELERRWGRPLLKAGVDLRKQHHVDHLGIHPQKRPGHGYEGPNLYYVGVLVPVGRITTAQLRGVADLAERYGNGEVRLTVGQNLIIPNIPEDRIGLLTGEPLFQELPYDPSPIMRGLVSCTGTDYCPLALIETKGYAVQVARELERRTAGRKVLPLTIHWSGCPAGCGMHQVATIGLQGCRSRVNGEVVDAAHVCVKGRTGPNPVVATDLMYDVPVDRLAEALEPLVSYLPR